MRPLTTTELLAAWEEGSALAPAARPLALLSAGCPDRPADELAQLPVGRRDALLMLEREWAFGGEVVSIAGCLECSQPVELRFRLADVRVDGTPADEPIELRSRGYRLRVRTPTSADLQAVAGAADEAGATSELLRRCVLSARRGGEPVGAEDLPHEVVEAIDRRLAAADPQADVNLTLTCDACGHKWLGTFDIGDFFWTEVETWAQRVLHDVHSLALAYGWDEPTVLTLSPRRRQHYLDLVGG